MFRYGDMAHLRFLKKWTAVLKAHSCFHVKRCDVGEDVKIVELKYAAQQRLAGQPQI